jgi:hypothetical protein
MAKNEMKRRPNLILVCLIAILLSGCSERFTEYYPKYEDAVQDGAVKRGWIPEIVPTTATEIHEQHDLDSNDVWIRFTVPRLDRDRLTSGLKKLSDDEILKLKVRHPARADWWFEGLIQQSPANDNALNAEIYTLKCHDDRAGYVAFDRTGPRIYYWCTW